MGALYLFIGLIWAVLFHRELQQQQALEKDDIPVDIVFWICIVFIMLAWPAVVGWMIIEMYRMLR